ncbi:MAG: hypothetical protein LBC17_04885 [Lactobacillaceae bacterium]|jgi:hypothetical protein|nr:hypothetical protein [Lactobacillaceae bacterium]
MKNLKILTIGIAFGNLVLAILISVYGLKTYTEFISKYKTSLSKTESQKLWLDVTSNHTRILQVILISLFLLFTAHIMAILLFRSYKQKLSPLILGIFSIVSFFILGAVIVSPLLFISAGLLFYQLFKWKKTGFNKDIQAETIKIK